MTEREQFEAHIETTAWYGVLSQAAKNDDDGASVFRMARMAAHEAWNASRSSALEEAAKVCDERAEAYWKAYKLSPPDDVNRANPHVEGMSDGAENCADAIRALKDPQ
jgi:hypothetical protein